MFVQSSASFLLSVVSGCRYYKKIKEMCEKSPVYWRLGDSSGTAYSPAEFITSFILKKKTMRCNLHLKSTMK